MKFLHISLVLTVLMANLTVTPAGSSGQATMHVSMPNRPFAIEPRRSHTLYDGYFDVSLNDHMIGLFLLNDGLVPINNVSATASIPASSGIVLTDNSENFGTLQPGVPVLGFFRANFGGSSPGKYPLSLQVSGDSFSQSVSRNIFVVRNVLVSETPFKAVSHIPEGKITIEHFTFYGGANAVSLMVPTSLKWVVEYNQPFPGQFSPLPFSDPLWKAIGGGVAAAAGILSTDDTYCKELLAVAACAGTTAMLLDGADPFLRGQQNTVPGTGELTIKEDVELSSTFPQEPVVGTPYSGNVTWTYTRTTNLKKYQYSVSEQVTNIHSTTSRTVTMNLVGQDVVIKAQAGGGPQPLRNNNAYFVANMYLADDTSFTNVVQSAVLRDDGHLGDATANDGLYTGIIPASVLPRGVRLNAYAFGYDLNNASESDPPLVAAQEIGGLLVSAPRPGSGSVASNSLPPPCSCITPCFDPDVDPVVKVITREAGKPVTHTLTGIPHIEHKVTVFNHSPGLKNLAVTVNGREFRIAGLKDNEQQTVDVSSAMIEGEANTILLTAHGKPGGSALVVIHD